MNPAMSVLISFVILTLASLAEDKYRNYRESPLSSAFVVLTCFFVSTCLAMVALPALQSQATSALTVTGILMLAVALADTFIYRLEYIVRFIRDEFRPPE